MCEESRSLSLTRFIIGGYQSHYHVYETDATEKPFKEESDGLDALPADPTSIEKSSRRFLLTFMLGTMLVSSSLKVLLDTVGNISGYGTPNLDGVRAYISDRRHSRRASYVSYGRRVCCSAKEGRREPKAPAWLLFLHFPPIHLAVPFPFGQIRSCLRVDHDR